MPILRFEDGLPTPKSEPKKTSLTPEDPVEWFSSVVPLTSSVKDAIRGFPVLEETQHIKVLQTKYILPNRDKYIDFRGYKIRFMPALSRRRGSFCRVIALMAQTPVHGWQDPDYMPTLRLATYDLDEWETQLNKWLDRLDRDNKVPVEPVLDDGEYEPPPNMPTHYHWPRSAVIKTMRVAASIAFVMFMMVFAHRPALAGDFTDSIVGGVAVHSIQKILVRRKNR